MIFSGPVIVSPLIKIGGCGNLMLYEIMIDCRVVSLLAMTKSNYFSSILLSSSEYSIL